jgi:hypothetical protein
MSLEFFSEEQIDDAAEKFEIAAAIADHDVKETALLRRIEAEMHGVRYEEMSANESIDMANKYIAIYIGYMTDPAAMKAEDKVVNQDEHIGQQLAAYGRELMNATGIDDAYYAQQFLNRLEIAQTLATEANKSVAQVFSDDDTYYDIYRRDQTPTEFAEEAVNAITHITADTLIAAQARHIERFIAPERLADMTLEDKVEIALNLQFDQGYHEHMEEIAETQQEIMRQMATYSIIKIYGYENLLALDPVILGKIQPQREWVHEVFAEFFH